MFEMKYGREGVPLKNEVMENAKNQEVPNAPIVPTVEQVQTGQVEVQTQETEEVYDQTAQASQEQDIQESTQPTQSAPSDDPKSRDWRELREKSTRAEKERDEAMRRLAEYERILSQQAQQQNNNKPQEAPDEDDIKLGDDELAEGKHLSKVGRKIKKLEEQLKQYQQQTTLQTTEARLKATYPDFEKVVTQEALEKFTREYPELSSTINMSSNDIYAKAVSAYTMIKKFGLYAEPAFEAERAQAIKNAAKPRPLSSVSPQQGDGALTRANAFANGLTTELKEQLRREMEDARRNM